MRAYKVYAIKNGTAIDHIPQGRALKVIDVLDLEEEKGIVTCGMNFESKRLGKKDVVKIENKELEPKEVNAITIVAPTATLNIIRNFKVAKKIKVKVPKVIEEIVECNNPNCITRNEKVPTKFYPISSHPLVIKCHYCERTIPYEEITLL